jgi:hypothetical protein
MTQKDGVPYQYFKIGHEVQEKTLVIDLPSDAAYAVYEGEGQCLDFSIVTENNSAILPAQGWIVLLGSAGDTFTLQYR